VGTFLESASGKETETGFVGYIDVGIKLMNTQVSEAIFREKL
jgi:hypothetical protein